MTGRMERGTAPNGPAAPSPAQTQVVIDGVKTLLLAGELGPGARLPVEKDLAERLGVSRGPLREGVRALVAMGVLETRQGSGTFVTALSVDRLLQPLSFAMELQGSSSAAELHEIRRSLEADAAAAAALRLTTDDHAAALAILDPVDALLDAPDVDHETLMDADIAFHRLVARVAGNVARAALIDALAARTVRVRLWRAVSVGGAERAAQAEHRAVLDALVAGRPDHARIRMESHLLGVERFMTQPLAAQDGDHGSAASRSGDSR